MKRSKSIIWGLALVVLGIIWGGNAVGLYNIDLFFGGWWTLFIIVPSFIGLFSDNDRVSDLIGLVIGILLLLACQDVIDFDILWKLLVPFIIIWIGLSLIFKGSKFNLPKTDSKSIGENVNAVFAGHDIKVDDEFKGTDLKAVFGGIDLDLRRAKINSDVTVNVTCVFGGVDLYIPENVKIKVQTNSVFGGVDQSKLTDIENAEYTIYINATCIFGGVEIKR